MAPGRRLCGPHPQGRQARGLAGSAGKQIRAGHQYPDRHDARPRSAADAARSRRRGDRVMRRREFITLLGGAAAAWPLGARAEPAGSIPRIGIIEDGQGWDHFRRGLHDLGYIVDQNIVIEHRLADANVDRLRQAVRELASVPVSIIVTYGSPATRAAQESTSVIPIVMIGIGDPVRAGFVDDLARPNGNITGNSILGPDLIGKRLEILKECVPGLARVAFLWNPDNDSNLAFLEELIIAVPALGLQLISVPMRQSSDFERAFAAMMRRQPNAFATTNDNLILLHMDKIIDFMVRHRLRHIPDE